MILSICMMVKDEQKNLVKCLESLRYLQQSIDTELIVVDTGSVDNTVQIAKQYTDKVFFHKWNNDFSGMRNITIGYARGEWILVIDADEIIMNYGELVDFLKTDVKGYFGAASVVVKNITRGDSFNKVVSVRLFRNDGYFHYTGKVHNTPIYEGTVFQLDTVIEHYGYISTDNELMERKFQRTASLLKSELDKDTSSIYYKYQLAVSYRMHKDYKEALEVIREVYKTIKDQGLNLIDYVYIFFELAIGYLGEKDYENVVLVCEEGIKTEPELIDLYFCLGEAEAFLNKNDEAIKHYEKFLDLIEQYDNLKIRRNGLVIVNTFDKVETVYYNLSLLLFKQEQFEKTIYYIEKINDGEYIQKSIDLLIESCVKFNKFDEIKSYYVDKFENELNNSKDIFYNILERNKKELNNSDSQLIVELFSAGDDYYSILNKIRIQYYRNDEDIFKTINEFVEIADFNKLPSYFSDIIYFCLCLGIDISNMLISFDQETINRYFEDLNTRYKDFYDVVIRYLKKCQNSESFKSIKVNKQLSKQCLLLNDDAPDYKAIFEDYLNNAIKYMNYVYNENIFCEQLLHEVKNSEERFLLNIILANKVKTTDEGLYIEYLRKALTEYPLMNKGISILLDEVRLRKLEFENYKAAVKGKIVELINIEKVEEAQSLLEEYENIVKNDIEVYSIKGAIAIQMDEFRVAEASFKEGLEIDPNNFDLLYNLAYLYELQNKDDEAVIYYRLALDNTKRFKMKEIIINSINNLLNRKVNHEMFDEKIKTDSTNLKCLILCHFYSIYTEEFIKNLKKDYEVDFDILTMDSSYNKMPEKTLNKSYLYSTADEMQRKLDTLEVYDIIHVHFLTPFYAKLAEKIRNRCRKLIITIWGSDFYRTSQEEKQAQKYLINKADSITFDNDITLEEFIQYYGQEYREKAVISRFGLTALESIKEIDDMQVETIKKSMGIPDNSIVVMCGYNANSAHNHLGIIDTIIANKSKLPENVHYIFPMTYSKEFNYIDKVKKALSLSGLKYKILEEFMDFEQMAMLTKITDIMIQVQKTDTLSATMQENMYNGNIIITGSWLPYEPLKRNQVYFLEVSSVENIGDVLIYAVNNMDSIKERCTRNRDIIWNFSAWGNTIEQWMDIYDKCVTPREVFDHASFWDQRYLRKFDLESSGYMGLGEVYNKFLYKSRLDIIEYLVRYLYQDINEKNVLELGPGTGFFTNYFQMQNVGGYFGIDISKNAVKILSKQYAGFNFKCGDISNYGVYPENQKYDLIFASDVLLHLTDKLKFQQSIRNIALKLTDSGYYIDIEPITMIDVETESRHNIIIKYDELKYALEKENLKLLAVIPVTYFMDYPFDYMIAEKRGNRVLNTFGKIFDYFNSVNNPIKDKEIIAQNLYSLDKMCLLKYQIGLSNKVIIAGKKGNEEKISIPIENIWNDNKLEINNDLNSPLIKEIINQILIQSSENQI